MNVIIPVRDIMIIEKQPENSNLPEIEIQSALFITAKERVKKLKDLKNF